MQDAKFIDELNHTQNPPAPSWCPCVQIPVTEEQVEFTERLPAIQCDRGHLDLMCQNVLLRAGLPYSPNRTEEDARQKAHDACTQQEAVVALLKENAAIRTQISVLELALDEIYCSVRRTFSVRLKAEDNKAVPYVADNEHSKNIELLAEVRRLRKIINELGVSSQTLDRWNDEDNIKPRVTGQGAPPRPSPKKS
jgi:hypothetical protein